MPSHRKALFVELKNSANSLLASRSPSHHLLSSVKILFIGDIVGEPGRKAVKDLLPRLRREAAKWNPESSRTGGEFRRGGSGTGTPGKIAEELLLRDGRRQHHYHRRPPMGPEGSHHLAAKRIALSAATELSCRRGTPGHCGQSVDLIRRIISLRSASSIFSGAPSCPTTWTIPSPASAPKSNRMRQKYAQYYFSRFPYAEATSVQKAAMGRMVGTAKISALVETMRTHSTSSKPRMNKSFPAAPRS